MLFIIGCIIVFASVFIGYMMHAGDIMLLWQPNELVIIVGAGIGSILIANPMSTIVETIKACKCLIYGGKPYNKGEYLELLLFCFNTFKLMKVKGMLEIESHIENSNESELFSQAPSISKEGFMHSFVLDNLRLLTMGVDNFHQFEDNLSKEIEVYEEGARAPCKLILTFADALPALGIVAAVLGVIVTMRSIMEPPEILGALIAAALVGTFTGVLLSYGLVGPIGNLLSKNADYRVEYLECIKYGFLAYLNNNPPIIIVEYMRKCIPECERPSFQELDRFISGASMKIMSN